MNKRQRRKYDQKREMWAQYWMAQAHRNPVTRAMALKGLPKLMKKMPRFSRKEKREVMPELMMHIICSTHARNRIYPNEIARMIFAEEQLPSKELVYDNKEAE